MSLRVILICFADTSGLLIKWIKRQLYHVNKVQRMQSLPKILGGVLGNLPTTYLGMPLGTESKSNDIWNGVLVRCEK